MDSKKHTHTAKNNTAKTYVPSTTFDTMKRYKKNTPEKRPETPKKTRTSLGGKKSKKSKKSKSRRTRRYR